MLVLSRTRCWPVWYRSNNFAALRNLSVASPNSHLSIQPITKVHVSQYHSSVICRFSNSAVNIETITDAAGNIYKGETRNGLMHGKGVMKYKSGSVFDGTWKDGKFDGSGTFTSQMGVFCGEVKNGQLEGFGVIKYADGDVYEGTFQNNCKHGRGKLLFEGLEYEGEFDMDTRAGQGTLKLPNGDVYVGNFVDDAMEGFGVMRYGNGDVYEGSWKDAKVSGEGKYTYADQTVYEGQWSNAEYSGKGTLKSPNGDVYEGDFAAHKFHGSGSLTVAGKFTYKGDFAEGDMNGFGRAEAADGSEVFEGEFVAGEYEGGGVLQTKDFTYEGSFKAGLKHGRGFLSLSNGDTFDGQFLDNKAHGHGELVGTNGLKYKGDWADNIMSGHGELQQADGGDHYVGEFLKGVYHGYGVLTVAGLVDSTLKDLNKKSGNESQGEPSTAAVEATKAKLADMLVKATLTPAIQTARNYQLGMKELNTPGVVEKMLADHGGHENLLLAANNAEKMQEQQLTDGSDKPDEVVDLSTPLDIEGTDITPGMLKEFRDVLLSPVARIYEGYFKDGKQHGEGKLILPNGLTYTGTWSEDDMHGKIIVRDGQDKLMYEAMYEKGQFVKYLNRNAEALNNLQSKFEPEDEVSKLSDEQLKIMGVDPSSVRDVSVPVRLSKYTQLPSLPSGPAGEALKNRKQLK